MRSSTNESVILEQEDAATSVFVKHISVLTLTISLSARIAQNPGKIRLFLGNSYANGSTVWFLFSMTFIARSLPLNLDILLLGVVEPPDWAGESLGPRSGLITCTKNQH
jgi:hypothetical protein